MQFSLQYIPLRRYSFSFWHLIEQKIEICGLPSLNKFSHSEFSNYHQPSSLAKFEVLLGSAKLPAWICFCVHACMFTVLVRLNIKLTPFYNKPCVKVILRAILLVQDHQSQLKQIDALLLLFSKSHIRLNGTCPNKSRKPFPDPSKGGRSGLFMQLPFPMVLPGHLSNLLQEAHRNHVRLIRRNLLLHLIPGSFCVTFTLPRTIHNKPRFRLKKFPHMIHLLLLSAHRQASSQSTIHSWKIIWRAPTNLLEGAWEPIHTLKISCVLVMALERRKEPAKNDNLFNLSTLLAHSWFFSQRTTVCNKVLARHKIDGKHSGNVLITEFIPEKGLLVVLLLCHTKYSTWQKGPYLPWWLWLWWLGLHPKFMLMWLSRFHRPGYMILTLWTHFGKDGKQRKVLGFVHFPRPFLVLESRFVWLIIHDVVGASTNQSFFIENLRLNRLLEKNVWINLNNVLCYSKNVFS